MNISIRVILFSFFLQTPLTSSHTTAPPEWEGRGDLIVHHLGAVTRWANIPYGWHGNGLLGLGWALFARDSFLLLPHSCNIRILTWAQRTACVFWSKSFMEVFEVWVVEGGIGRWRKKKRCSRGNKRGKTKRAGEQLIFRQMRKWGVQRQQRDRRRNHIILCALPATEAEREH